jgi:elongation factor Ts
MSQPITAAAVNELRKRTDMPMMECKSALQEAGGDMNKAVEILRGRNSKMRDKRALNETAEGRIAIQIDPAAQVAAILEMRCESAPVAKSEHFIALANDLAKRIAQTAPKSIEELTANPAVTERINEVIGLIRENMKPQRFWRLAGDLFGEYVHHDGSVGVLLQVKGAKADPALLRDVCAHIAALTPPYIRVEAVPADIVAREKELARQQAAARSEGKPANIIEKIAEGLLKTWYSENVLLEQPMANAVKYEKKTVGQLLKAAGLDVIKYVRFKVGEVPLQ